MTEETLSEGRFLEIISRFSQSHIAVLGDFFLDEYLVLDKRLSEISVETGLEAYQVAATRKAAGAAGTVTNILRSLEVPVTAIGFTGEDGHSYELRKALSTLDVNIDHLAAFPDRFTPTYTKPMLLKDGKETELSRMDTKNRHTLGQAHENVLMDSIRKVLPQVKALLVVDQVQEQNCGAVTDVIRRELAELSMQYPEKIIMTDSREHMSLFKNTIVKFNVNEASKMFGLTMPQYDPSFILDLSQKLYQHYHKPIILTLGEKGLQVTDEKSSAWIPAIPVSGPTDIVGAGDSVMASIGASLSVGASLVEASIIGTVTASLIIQQIGTTGTASQEQIKQRFLEEKDFLNQHIRSAVLN